jgi:hypothetical protein
MQNAGHSFARNDAKELRAQRNPSAFLPCLALFAPWRSWRATEAKRTFGEIGMEPERGVRGSTRLQKKEMKGPQGLGDAGAEAKTERAFSRVSELLLGAFADRPPYRRTLVLLPGCRATYRARLSDVQRIARKAWLQGIGPLRQSPTSALPQQCPTAIPALIIARQCTCVNVYLRPLSRIEAQVVCLHTLRSRKSWRAVGARWRIES